MYTFAGAVLCAFIFIAIISVDTRAIRENELQCALSDAVRETVEEIHVSDFRYPLSDEEMIALFEQLLLTRLSVNGKTIDNAPDVTGDPNFSLQVDVAGADAARGLLFVHVKETFTYPNGKTGTIEDTASLLIEQEVNRDMITVTYEHTDEFIRKNEQNGSSPMEKTIQVYKIEADQSIPSPSCCDDWVLIETSDSGDLTYIPANEALSTDAAAILPAASDATAPSPEENSLPAASDATVSSPEENSPEDVSIPEKEILVAVIDTGIDLSQNENPFSPLYHRISSLTDPSITDPVGHGSAMASIIAEHTPENVKILALKAFDENGRGSSELSCNAMEEALNYGADILNLSFTGEGISTRMQDLIQNAQDAGCIVIAAAGNKSSDAAGYIPAGIEAAITVSAVDETQTFAPYSNHGSCVDFAADGYARISMGTGDPADDKLYIGTSVATAHVSSYAALLLSSIGEDAIDVRRSFLSSAIDLGEPGRDVLYGDGYLSHEQLIHIVKEYNENLCPALPERSDGSDTSDSEIPAVYADEDILLSESAIKTKRMTYSTSTPIHLSDFGAGASITVAWDNANGYPRDKGLEIFCTNGTVTKGPNYITAVSPDGNFDIKLDRFDFSRNSQSQTSHAIMVLVTPGTKTGFVYTMAGRENSLASYSFQMDPVDNDFLYEPFGGYSFAASTVGAIILKKQPVAYWCSTPELTAIPARENDENGCTIFVSPSIDGTYYCNFYGQWSPKTTTVNYDGNGGTIVGAASQRYEYSFTESTRLIDTTAVRNGYTMTGWNTSPDGTGQSYPNGYDLKTHTANRASEHETINLYATWSSTAYTVHFNPSPLSLCTHNINGDPYSTEPTGTMPDQSMEAKKYTRLSACTFKRKGYVFIGWARDPHNSKADYADKAYVRGLVPLSATERSITLYAIWSPIRYYIRYHSNGVNSGAMSDQIFFYDRADLLAENRFYESFNGQAVSSVIFNSYHTSPTASGGEAYGISSDIPTADSHLSDTPKSSWKEQECVYNLTDSPYMIIHLYAIWDVDFTLSLSADILADETNRHDLYDTGAWNYNATRDTVSFPHIGTLASAAEGSDNPLLRRTFHLPDAYPFVMEKNVTAQSRLHYDDNAQEYTACTYHYSQQGWAWNSRRMAQDNVITYKNADYKKGDWLTVSPSFRQNPDLNVLNYPDWLLYAINSHPQNVMADDNGFLIVTLFAVWDEAPVIRAYDRYFTSDELSGYLDEDRLLTVLADTDYLLAEDKEDGILTDSTPDGITFDNGEAALELTPDIDKLRIFLDSSADRFAISTTVTAKDAVWNISFCTFMIYVTSSLPIRSTEKAPASPAAAAFVRAIDSVNYYKHCKTNEADLITANKNGALKAHSLWYEDEGYTSVIKKALAAIDNDSGYSYTKTYKRKEIKEIQNYCAANGYGITQADPDRLKKWIALFH